MLKFGTILDLEPLINFINLFFVADYHLPAELNEDILAFLSLALLSSACWHLLTAYESFYKKINFSFHSYTKGDIHAKFQLSRLIFIFISFYQLSSAVDNCWQLMIADMEKNNCNLYVHSIGDVFAKFQLSRLIYIYLLPFNRCCQLLTADDSCQEKNHLEFSSTP